MQTSAGSANHVLVLVRHGESEWNLKNLFTGWRDVDLSPKGIEEAQSAGQKLKAQGLQFDLAFTSALIRAQRTLTLMLDELGQNDIPVFKDQALNERDYGDLVGLNKDDARAKWGAEQVLIWRRSYDQPPPGGESLFAGNSARGIARRARACLGARQFVARTRHGARAPLTCRDCEAGDRHRRAADVLAERRLDGGSQARA
jgi:bisphosphoglycerate-dependent phosphoglycerate mutase